MKKGGRQQEDDEHEPLGGRKDEEDDDEQDEDGLEGLDELLDLGEDGTKKRPAAKTKAKAKAKGGSMKRPAKNKSEAGEDCPSSALT